MNRLASLLGVLACAALGSGCAWFTPSAAPAITAPFDGAVATIEVRVSGLGGAGGTAAFALFDDPAAFDAGGAPARDRMLAVDATRVTWHVEVPHGAYALKVYHDANGNGTLDVNAFGLPGEPYGFSNDATASFGPPEFQAARFEVRGDRTVDINLR